MVRDRYAEDSVRSFGLLVFAIPVVFFGLALLAKVVLQKRSHMSLLVDVHGILRAVFTPVPLVGLASPDIIRHSNHPKTTFADKYFSVLGQIKLGIAH